jgi:hypothetical protein
MELSNSSQPRQQEAYNEAENPVSKNPSEVQSSHKHPSGYGAVEKRGPEDQSTTIDDANPSSLARGVRGTGSDDQEVIPSSNENPDDQKLAPPSEGRVYDAVTKASRPGAGGQEPSLTADLDKYA